MRVQHLIFRAPSMPGSATLTTNSKERSIGVSATYLA